MPVTVETPIHLVVDEEALRQAPHEIEAALDQALRSVLARTRAEVLEDRGGYVGTRLQEPDFAWSGLPVDAAVRRRLEASSRDLIRRAAEIAGLFEFGRQTDKLDLPLSDTAVETLDRRRHSALFRVYGVPSYQGGETVAVPTEGEEGPALYTRERWSPVPFRFVNLAVARQTLIDQEISLPPPETVAILVQAMGGNFKYGLFVFTPDGGETALNIQTVIGYRSIPNPPYFRFDPDAELEPVNGTVERVDIDASLSSRIEALRTVFETSIRNHILTLPMPEGMASDERALAIERAIDLELKRRAEAEGMSRIAMLLVFRMGGQVSTIGFEADVVPHVHFTGTVNVQPWVETAFVMGGPGEEGTGSGGAQGTAETGGRSAGTGGEGHGDGTGTGTGGRGSRRPGIVYTGQPGEGGEGLLFPTMPGEGEALVCEPFLDEPTVDELGDVGETMRRMIAEIAARLDMSPCEYPANFCLMAARTIRGRASDVSGYAAVTGTEFTQNVPEGTGNLGSIAFHPTAAPAIQYMRHLAGVVPRVGALMRLINEAYVVHSDRVTRNYFSNIYSWLLRFMIAYGDSMDEAVQTIFEQSCRVLMLQLLETSRQQIQGRLDNFERYAPLFENMITKWLRQPAELTELRSRLQRHEAARWVETQAGRGADAVLQSGASTSEHALATATASIPGTPQQTAVLWMGAARVLSGAFLAIEGAAQTAGEAGEIFERGGVARIRDSQGRAWTMTELEEAIVTTRGEAEDIDPLIKQIRDLPETFRRFETHPQHARRELRTLLEEMLANNAEMRQKTIDDPYFAFAASSMIDNIPQATIPSSRYALQGIHLQVHYQIGEFFRGDPYYARGVDQAISIYLGREAIVNFVVAVDIVILSVFCAPLGFIAGLAAAGHEVAKAEERARMHAALIDPDLVISRAEVEVGLFAAYLGLALAFIPEAGTILGAARQGVRGGLRVGIAGGARLAGRYIARRVTRQAVASLSRELFPAFVRELAEDQLMNVIIQQALEPLIARYQREAMIVSSVGGSQGAQSIMLMLASESRSGGSR
jgi:hypothetical protein